MTLTESVRVVAIVARSQRRLVSLFFLLLLASDCSTVTAPLEGTPVVLGTATLRNGSTIRNEHRIHPAFAIETDFSRTLFDDAWVDSSDVGLTLEASAQSDSDFNTIMAQLENGTSQDACIGWRESTGIGSTFFCTSEKQLFDLPAVDFATSNIREITMRIDSLAFGLDPRGGAIVLFTFTVTVLGDPPPPHRSRGVFTAAGLTPVRVDQ